MYFTDPIYRRTWWDAAVTRPSQSVRAVYFFNPRDQSVKRVAEVTMPNGIVGTPDGKTLYVADINARKIWGYDIQADGSLTQARVICNFGSDGMTLDDQGNLYLSANVGGGPGGGKGKGRAPAPGAAPATPQPAPIRGVTVVDTKTGKVKGFIPVPEQPANMCFGGKNRDVLYITARTGFYSIPTKVKGANPAK
jgi:gluconolactonase